MRLTHCFCLSALAALLPAVRGTAANPPTLELVQTIVLKGKAGKLDHLALDGPRERLLLANTINGTLDVIDLKAGKLLKQVTGQPGIQGVAFAADLDRVFVGLGTGGLCNVFDGADYRLLKTIKFADDADNVRYDPASHQVIVAHADKMLGAVDAKTFAVLADIKLPGAAEGFQIESKRSRMFLAVPTPSQLVLIDTNNKVITGTYPVSKAEDGHAVALDEANQRVFLGCRKEPMIVVLAADTGKETAGIPIPKDNDDLFYDAKRKRLYASCGDGFLIVIRQVDPDHYEMAEKIETPPRAKTCLFDPTVGRIFLAVPRQAGKEGPEIRIYKVRD